ncbi:hypothetical protein Focb16_v013187 [Fusarium oxysporum f. sp. cubense]|uniref:DUF6546 domain-containing protein n=1 Tax=Fusarium oxysporum f. sp. cubense TaxID=61366 RepID=A0A559KP13_FUSOC|nr:hypothetical protein Focb16_v013187 [Fusarium oxysporum f. sp. cubense]
MTQSPAVTGYKKVPLIRPPRRSNSAPGKSRILRDNINAMESLPDTTALWIPTSHTSLHFDVQVGIVNDLIELYENAQHPSKRLAHLATVSRTWQRLVEEHNFQDLRLTVADLAVFQKYVHSERRPFVKSIILRVSGGLTWPGSVDWTILPDFFSGVIMSTTAIKSIHIEEWGSGFGICSNRAFSTPFTLPPSVKQLSYFHSVSQYPEMNLGAPNTELLDHISQASDYLEHIAVSYAISASDFFDHCKKAEVEFKELKTLALTYHFDGVSDHALLITAAEAAKRMPALEMLEIWKCEISRLGGASSEREAHIFGYKKLDQGKGRITWTSSGNHRLPACVRNAWKNVLTGGQSRTLEVKEHHLPQDLRMKLTKTFPHLMLKEQILRDVSRKRALLCDM